MDGKWQRAGTFGILLSILALAFQLVAAPMLRAADQTPAPSSGGEQPPGPSDDGPLDEDATAFADGRYTLTTRRGGTPELGVAVARGLHLPEAGGLADFTLSADVRFERGGGPAAATVRFRYQPEAGGGSGYLLSIDPFAAQVRLAAFEEGRQEILAPWATHPAAGVGAGTMRLRLEAAGPTIAVSLNGEEVLRTADDRFASGLVAVGAVTWSEPVTVTFENVAITVPGA